MLRAMTKEELQNDLERLPEWSRIWQFPIIAFECIRMHIGHQITETHIVNNIELPFVPTHIDARVIFSQDPKITAHCCAVAAKSFRTILSIYRVFNHVYAKTFLTLYTMFVRPKLEYCVQTASLCLKVNWGVVKGSKNGHWVDIWNVEAAIWRDTG